MRRKIGTWKWILPVCVTALGLVVLAGVVHFSIEKNHKQVRTVTELNAMNYAERMVSDLNHGISITESIQAIIVSDNGRIDNFDEIAADLIDDTIQSIQIAPDGVVTDIYPAAGNEAGKIDLIHDEQRGEISRYSRDHDLTIMQGPFSLQQGGMGIAIRNPVYLKNDAGQEYFWGFTIAIIRVPDIFANSVQALNNFGYDYRLSKTESPLTSQYQEISASAEDMTDPVSYEFELCGCSFKLEVMPKEGWNRGDNVGQILIVGILIIILLSGLTGSVLILEEHRQQLEELSTTDALTGLYNRNGFEKCFGEYRRKNPNQSCVGIQLDIDDFKMINDIYGHVVGDQALQNLAQSMRTAFPANAIYGRNGGDEFTLILTGATCDDVKEQIEAFTASDRSFMYEGREYYFHISVGYAEYPADTEEADRLLGLADMALYEGKLRGKAKSMRYQKDFDPNRRNRLGFALSDITQHLPGAFLIYKADPENDQLLFANQELVTYAGCKNLDEFMQYSKHSFRNLIRSDEQEAVEKSIWQQIRSQADGTNDFVQFHFVKKDGSTHPVLDHGRIVESNYYGNVFYVLIMDCQLLDEHYD